jgi:hypothetical protein
VGRRELVGIVGDGLLLVRVVFGVPGFVVRGVGRGRGGVGGGGVGAGEAVDIGYGVGQAAAELAPGVRSAVVFPAEGGGEGAGGGRAFGERGAHGSEVFLGGHVMLLQFAIDLGIFVKLLGLQLVFSQAVDDVSEHFVLAVGAELSAFLVEVGQHGGLTVDD